MTIDTMTSKVSDQQSIKGQLAENELSEEELSFKPDQLTLEEWQAYLLDGEKKDWREVYDGECEFESEYSRKEMRIVWLSSAANFALRFKNRDKYRTSEDYYEDIDNSYLHHDNYETRKAKAEQLNGCQFKTAKPYKQFKWLTWGAAVEPDKSAYSSLVNCDGKTATLAANLSFWALTTLLQIVLFITALSYLFTANWLLGLSLTVVSIWGCNYLRKKLRPLDFFLFNRHTGLVRTPQCLFRRPFYLPFEDLQCYIGSTSRGARIGGKMGTAKIRATQIPKRFYLFTPSFILQLGGISGDDWNAIINFMDTSEAVNDSMYEYIEYYYRIDTNVAGDGSFPEELKAYIDPDDNQVNKWEVW
ncbi:MAG: hypothetical protein GY787_12555 [Alteromonadales bacterium]|nr:hypothetical protein [Alteromonadales bacterium]